MIWDYLRTLKEEYKKINGPFTTIYIGGGTPSMLNNEQLIFLLNIFKDEKPLEFTIEVNPESYTEEKGLIFKEYNVNRVSLGVQTFNPVHLKRLNRIHTNEQVFNCINSLNSIGLDNISIDLMFALPDQTIKEVLEDIKTLKKLKVKHISYYELFIEDKTLFHHQYKKGILKEVDADLQANMYEAIISNLKDIGFSQYEVSNYSKAKEYESIHNKIYWQAYPYEAIGAGAHGFNGKYRYYHTTNVGEYIKDAKIVKTLQTTEDIYKDYLIFGLRMNEGISISKTKQRFNRNPLTEFKELDEFIKNGLLKYENDYLKTTLKGMFLLNKIAEVFVWTF